MYPHDLWSCTPPVPGEWELGEHILALYVAIRPRIEYIKVLKRRTLALSANRD